jgi:hypothetical protein
MFLCMYVFTSFYKVVSIIVILQVWSELFSRSLVTTEYLTGANWVVKRDVERTQDRQTDRKLGPDV